MSYGRSEPPVDSVFRAVAPPLGTCVTDTLVEVLPESWAMLVKLGDRSADGVVNGIVGTFGCGLFKAYPAVRSSGLLNLTGEKLHFFSDLLDRISVTKLFRLFEAFL